MADGTHWHVTIAYECPRVDSCDLVVRVQAYDSHATVLSVLLRHYDRGFGSNIWYDLPIYSYSQSNTAISHSKCLQRQGDIDL